MSLPRRRFTLVVMAILGIAMSAPTEEDSQESVITESPTTTEATSSSAATTTTSSTETDGINCSRCIPHEEAKILRIESIKAQILSKLGIKSAPNMTGRPLPRIPPLHHLLDRYEMMQSDEPADGAFSPGPQYGEDDYHVAAEKVISFAQEPPRELNITEDLRKAQYFRFSDNVLNAHVVKAHLWMYIRPNSSASSPLKITLYQIIPGSQKLELLQVQQKKADVKSTRGRWFTMEVKKLVSQWFRHPEENLGVLIHSIDNAGGMGHVITADSGGGLDAMRPFIEVRVENKGRSRSRRMVGLNCQENSSEVRCCRYPLTVDFEEFGWDWIIAPKRYEANYCSGECPYVFLQRYPHTHLVQQANLSGPAGPCCAPRKVSPISMLYFDDNHNIIYGVLPGMIVDRCGCY